MSNNNNIIKQIKRTVLIVEDELINTEILSEILSDTYEIFTAENGKEALDVLQRALTPISLILLDINMPVMNGFEFLEIVKGDNEYKRIPVIVLTSEKENELRALELGAADFITKPYDLPAVIAARVRRSIELSEDRMIIKAAERDEVTDTYNEHIFLQYASKIDLYRPQEEMDLVVVNIFKFHLYNELNGYDTGEHTLRSMADILKEIVRQNNGIVGQLQSDYFVLYMTRIQNYDMLLEQIDRELTQKYNILNLRYRLGIYRIINKDESIRKRIDRARQVCDAVRDSNLERYRFFDQEAQKNNLFKERLLQDVRKAVREGQFEVYYQPKVNITGEKFVLSSAEALVRWNHPELGFISPGVFIPLFEENGTIQLVDRYVWKEAAGQVRKWKEKYGFTIPVSVNVSRIDLYDKNLTAHINQIIHEAGTGVDGFYLEVTESAYNTEIEQANEIIETLKKNGFTIEIDDFGSGFSSLNTIAALPLDVLKLDMKFVREMFVNDKTIKIIGIIADIARYLNVDLVAEGVETREQLDALKKMGYSVIQGYYFSKPVPADEFEKFLERNRINKNKEMN